MTPEERAEFRAFVREHHPDRGGDPEVFARGLARLRASSPTPREDDRRYDAPVSFVDLPPLPVRIVLAAVRTARRRARTRVDRPHP
ncbi:hypothetical protein [Pseudonocardia xishanensis]|uniref:J domain-containing protein n=1 Tax=Pseudonocardia xishanensis TaxID=630995 RepID=A0ABP8RQW1_9PSEU